MDCAGFPPEENQTALAELSAGSVGEAVRILADDGQVLFSRIAALINSAPKMNRGLIIALGDQCSGPSNASRYDMTVRLVSLALSRLARNGAGNPPRAEAAKDERALANRLSATPGQARIWANLEQMISARIQHARAVNLVPVDADRNLLRAMQVGAFGLREFGFGVQPVITIGRHGLIENGFADVFKVTPVTEGGFSGF